MQEEEESSDNWAVLVVDNPVEWIPPFKLSSASVATSDVIIDLPDDAVAHQLNNFTSYQNSFKENTTTVIVNTLLWLFSVENNSTSVCSPSADIKKNNVSSMDSPELGPFRSSRIHFCEPDDGFVDIPLN